jgi:hypothetical protein
MDCEAPEMNSTTNTHEFDEDAVCMHCGFDGAEWSHLKRHTHPDDADPNAKQPPCTQHRPSWRGVDLARGSDRTVIATVHIDADTQAVKMISAQELSRQFAIQHAFTLLRREGFRV